MKKLLLILFFAFLGFSKTQAQNVLKSDTFVWWSQPDVIGDDAQGVLFFSNAGHKKFTGYVSSSWKTNFDTTKNPGIGITRVSLDSGEFGYVSVNFNKPHTNQIGYPKFHADTTNIVVVWPTGNGFTAKDSITVQLYLKSYTAIAPLENNTSHLRFYPNPAQKYASFEGLAPNVYVRSITIYNMNGKQQSEWSWNNQIIDFGNLPAGEYIATFQFSNGTSEKYKLVRSLKFE